MLKFLLYFSIFSFALAKFNFDYYKNNLNFYDLIKNDKNFIKSNISKISNQELGESKKKNSNIILNLSNFYSNRPKIWICILSIL